MSDPMSSLSSTSLSIPIASPPPLQQQQQHQQELKQYRVRERQWIYLGPILAAPVAHICVTLYQNPKISLQTKKWLLGVGIVGSTVATISMRLYLMWHAGYPGRESPILQGPDSTAATSTTTIQQQRERWVTLQEKQEIENPSPATMAKQILRGFG